MSRNIFCLIYFQTTKDDYLNFKTKDLQILRSVKQPQIFDFHMPNCYNVNIDTTDNKYLNLLKKKNNLKFSRRRLGCSYIIFFKCNVQLQQTHFKI